LLKLIKMLDLVFNNKVGFRYFFLVKFRTLIIKNKFLLLFKCKNNRELLNFKYKLMLKNIQSQIGTVRILKSLFFFKSFRFLGGLKLFVFCNSDDLFFYVMNQGLKCLGFSFKFKFSTFIKVEELKYLYFNFTNNYFFLQILIYNIYYILIFVINKFFQNLLNYNKPH